MRKQKGHASRQAGQVLLALILIMSVALAIGLSIIQKSLVDVSSASKVEQSNRAFSAAEAGIERVLSGGSSTVDFSTDNQSSATGQSTPLIPFTSVGGIQQDALEYPPLGKEDFAHIWLANPYVSDAVTGAPVAFYIPPDNSIEIYWGNSSADKAAIEVRIVYFNGTSYLLEKPVSYFDSDVSRAANNGFTPVNDCSMASTPIPTTSGQSRIFYCKRVISSLHAGLMLVRMRLLYNSTSQPVAVRASGTCGANCSLPPQARIIFATGISGQTQRSIQLFQIEKVVPPYFDFAIFSSGVISK